MMELFTSRVLNRQVSAKAAFGRLSFFASGVGANLAVKVVSGI